MPPFQGVGGREMILRALGILQSSSQFSAAIFSPLKSRKLNPKSQPPELPPLNSQGEVLKRIHQSLVLWKICSFCRPGDFKHGDALGCGEELWK